MAKPETGTSPKTTTATSETPETVEDLESAEQKLEREAREAWHTIFEAYYNAMPPNLSPGQPTYLGTFGADWIKTKDPSVMDGAISYCHQKDLPVLPELLQFVHAAMQKRIKDGTSGTKAFRESKKEALLQQMAKFIFWEASVARASELAAFAGLSFSGPSFKASSLEKAYMKEKDRLDAFAASLFGDPSVSSAKKADLRQEYREIIEAKIPIPEEIIGTRR